MTKFRQKCKLKQKAATTFPEVRDASAFDILIAF